MGFVPVSIKRRQNILVTQSNKLTEARYFLTIGEQKVILLLISMISPDDTDFKDYEMKVSEFSQMMGLSGKSIYDRMDDTLDKLLSRVIHIPEKTGFLKIGWVSSARYIEGEGVMQLSFDKKLKPYLLQLKEQFTKYNLFLVAKFQSAYSVRIYMLLKQYESIGYREFEVLELKRILGVEGESYNDFKRFRARVINQAKKEFETKNKQAGGYMSDITFDLETIRTGRKITRLRFNIRKQKYQEQLPFDIPELEPVTPAVQALLDHKISEDKARKFQAEQGEEEVLNCIAKYEAKVKAGKVEDTDGGYLLRMLEGRAGKQSKAERQKQEDQQKQAETLKQAKEEEQRKEREEKLSIQFFQAEREKWLSSLSAEEQEAKLKEAKGQMGFSGSMVKDLESPLITDFIKSQIENYGERREAYIQENI